MNTTQWIGRKTLGIGIAMALLALCAACSSDSVVPKEEPKLEVTAPVIKIFTIAPADAPDKAGGSATVDAGGAVMLAWEVTGATSVRLSSEGGVLESQTVKAKGSQEVTGITKDDRFVLSATNEGGKPISKVVSVTVAAGPKVTVVNFEARPKDITEGQTTQLCFTVQPYESTVVIADKATGTEIYRKSNIAAITETPAETEEETGADDNDGGTTKVSEEAEAADDAAAGDADAASDVTGKVFADCSTEQTPGKGVHTYVLTVTDAEGNMNTPPAEAIVTVSSEAGAEVVSFTANGESPTLTLDTAGPVTLEWQVKPVDAEASLSSDGEEFKAVEVDAEGKGLVVIKVDQDVTYTLKVVDPASGDMTTATVDIRISTPPLPKVLKLTSNAISAFAGEEVTFTVIGTDQNLSLVDPAGEYHAMEGSTIALPVALSGAYQAVVMLDGGTEPAALSNAITVTVRNWGEVLGAGTKWSAVGVHPTEHLVLSGTDGAAVSVGVHVGGAVWSSAGVSGSVMAKGKKKPLGTVTAMFEHVSNVPADHLAKFGPFPVTAFAYGQDRVYAALAGGVLISKDNGGSWEAVDNFLLFDYHEYYKDKAESHPGCDGRRQQGIDSADTTIIGIQQACDVLVDGDRLLVASDRGVYYVDNVDRMMVDRSEANGWKGTRRPGKKIDLATNLIGVPTHEIVIDNTINPGTVYAATMFGVMSNSQRGEEDHWVAMSGGDMGTYTMGSFKKGDVQAVYAIAIDEVEGVLYAGTDSGDILVSADMTSTEWKAINNLEASVFSLAIEQETGAILAGTATGVYLSRDGGTTFVDITATMGVEGPVVVNDVAISSYENGGDYAAATEIGIFISHGADVAATPAVDESVLEDGEDVLEAGEAEAGADEQAESETDTATSTGAADGGTTDAGASDAGTSDGSDADNGELTPAGKAALMIL